MQEDILENLYQGNSLNQSQFEKLFKNIIEKKFSPIQIAAALISMKIRGETFEEIIGATNILLNQHAKSFPRPNILFSDITGTGGDKKNTINISTISAIVASTCNIKIIKHGNYSITSMTGSMDLLKNSNLQSKNYEYQALKNFQELGICFLCASQYYTIFQNVMNIRKKLKTPTLFNIIGPLINPARPPLALIGVYKKTLLAPITQALKSLNYLKALVVHCEGMDEVGLHAPTNVSELHDDGSINDYTLNPSDFGLDSYPIEDLYCNSRQTTYNYMITILKGQGKLAHNSVIAANVALLLKLFGYNDLRSNVLLALDKIHQGIPYTQLMSLLKR